MKKKTNLLELAEKIARYIYQANDNELNSWDRENYQRLAKRELKNYKKRK